MKYDLRCDGETDRTESTMGRLPRPQQLAEQHPHLWLTCYPPRGDMCQESSWVRVVFVVRGCIRELSNFRPVPSATYPLQHHRLFCPILPTWPPGQQEKACQGQEKVGGVASEVQDTLQSCTPLPLQQQVKVQRQQPSPCGLPL